MSSLLGGSSRGDKARNGAPLGPAQLQREQGTCCRQHGQSPKGPAQDSAADREGGNRILPWTRDCVSGGDVKKAYPVHRLPHAERGSVFADSTELAAAWWESVKSGRSRTHHPPRTDSVSPLERVTITSAATFWPRCRQMRRGHVRLGRGAGWRLPATLSCGGAAVQLTSGLRDCAEPVFFSDDTRIGLQRHHRPGTCTIPPAFGGPPRVLNSAAQSARFSPDGKWLAYIALEAHASTCVPTCGAKAARWRRVSVDNTSAVV